MSGSKVLRIATTDPSAIFSSKELAPRLIAVGGALLGPILWYLARKASVEYPEPEGESTMPLVSPSKFPFVAPAM